MIWKLRTDIEIQEELRILGYSEKDISYGKLTSLNIDQLPKGTINKL
jgi:hypothetical protein